MIIVPSSPFQYNLNIKAIKSVNCCFILYNKKIISDNSQKGKAIAIKYSYLNWIILLYQSQLIPWIKVEWVIKVNTILKFFLSKVTFHSFEESDILKCRIWSTVSKSTVQVKNIIKYLFTFGKYVGILKILLLNHHQWCHCFYNKIHFK